MPTRQAEYVLCIHNHSCEASLAVRKVYQRMTDADAEDETQYAFAKTAVLSVFCPVKTHLPSLGC